MALRGRTSSPSDEEVRRTIVVLEEAAFDIERGIDFYNDIEDGVGFYFRDPIITDIRRLGIYFGEHRSHLGFFRALSSRFPFAIYYQDQQETRQIVAVLDLRRSPEWIDKRLAERK